MTDSAVVGATPSAGLYQRVGKRTLDVVGSLFALILLSPLLLVLAIAVRMQLGAPVLFRQTRVGRDGDEFDVVKFRTMRHDRRIGHGLFSGRDRREVHKSEADPRHTRVGRVMRRWSLDELPQLVNVFRADMSLVGPRPELVEVARRHGLVEHPRHRVRPGMTGLWQVSTKRQGLLCENVELDADYVSRVTLVGDLAILARTVPAVLRAHGS